ncbi:hypothetical protein [Archangium lansingense]|uniref:Uncharacterized protein n=1 Tax=Archangium lansingense TaxID=2995310 RepID=A0ABT4A2D8_9BACT|nr:hypothetical protein [Archangium lansinium]MCY1075773.1 hypothetical protein [Archangium lansinium]
MDTALLSQQAQYSAELFVQMLLDDEGVDLDSGAWSVGWVDDFIEANRESWHQTLSAEQLERLRNLCGAFLGESLRERLDGKWIWTNQPAVEMTGTDGAVHVAFPFTKVAKHFANGEADSIYNFFIGMAVLTGRMSVDEDGVARMTQSEAEALGFRRTEE